MNLCGLFCSPKNKDKKIFTDFRGLETQSGTFHPSISKPLTFTKPKQDYFCVMMGIQKHKDYKLSQRKIRVTSLSCLADQWEN